MVERRYATILFCDLAGYTALSERLDVEDLRDIQARYQRLAADVIERWGGFLASFQGDGVLAFFGYPAAHETDAERGIRAALELVERVPALGGHAAQRGPARPPMCARVGLHTGLVVIGPDPAEAATGGHGAVGEAINLAARLQAGAPNGSVVVSRETLELVEGVFETEPLGPWTVRGLSRVVFVHRVLRARPGADRGWNRSRRGATRLVGRDAPLRELLGQWRELAERRAGCKVVHILGEAGVGKTRLVAELCERAEAEDAWTLQANCLEIFANTPLYPAASLLWSRTGLTADEAKAHGRAKIAKFLHAFGRAAAEEEVDIAAGLLGLPGAGPDAADAAPSPLIKQKQFALLASLFERGMGDQPTLLWVEDAHWIDRSSAELLAHVAERFAEKPLLIVLTLRSPSENAGLLRADATIRLEPLPLTDCLELARAVPGARALPDGTLLRAAEAADGIPLFAEQLTLSLIDQSAGKGGAGTAAGPGEAAALPLTLAEMLSERLDRLGDTRGIVQAAACAGRAFAPGPLANLLGLPRPAVLQALDALVEAEILRRRCDGAEDVYEFRHALLQRVAYESMLGSERRAMHARIADALRRGESVGPVLPGILAHHLTAAGDHTAAARAWLEAGVAAARRSAHTEAVGHIREGLRLLDHVAEPELRRQLEVELQASLIGPLAALHGTSSAELATCCRRGLQLCMDGEPTEQVFPFLFGLFTISLARHRIREAVSLAELFVSVAERKGYEPGRVVGHRILGMALITSGEPRRARESLEFSLGLHPPDQEFVDISTFGQDARVHGAALLGIALFCLGEVDEAVRAMLGAMRSAEALRHPYSLGLVLGHACWLFGHLGASEAQMREARRLIALSEQHRLGFLRTHGEAHFGWALCRQGDLAQGSAVMEQAIAAFDAANNNVGLVRYIASLADARRRTGRLSEAEALHARALRMVREGGELWFEAEAMRIGALIARDAGGRRAEEAETLLRDAAARARKRGMPAFELWCLLDLSRLLGPSRPDPAVAARVAELSHLQDLERRAAEAFRLHGYGGGRRAEFGARRPEHAPRGEPDGTRRRAPDA
ncbi:AAA family ATPase [Craurococcus roseus]|uniref:AAA family ATPase n=1 Tax=Craurococcus roseus TaxID=77585 RepID=A0ABN1FVY3_9PROT